MDHIATDGHQERPLRRTSARPARNELRTAACTASRDRRRGFRSGDADPPKFAAAHLRQRSSARPNRGRDFWNGWPDVFRGASRAQGGSAITRSKTPVQHGAEIRSSSERRTAPRGLSHGFGEAAQRSNIIAIDFAHDSRMDILGGGEAGRFDPDPAQQLSARSGRRRRVVLATHVHGRRLSGLSDLDWRVTSGRRARLSGAAGTLSLPRVGAIERSRASALRETLGDI